MLRKASEAVSVGSGPVHQEEKIGFGQPALVDEYRKIRSLSKQEIREDRITRRLEQLLECQEHEAQQPRLAMEADGPANTKTQERTEGAATAVQAMRGDSFTAEQKVQDGPKTSITFGMEAESPNLPCRDDVLVEGGDAAPRSCPPSLEVRSPTAAGGLVPTGEASTATEDNFNQPPLRFCPTEETDPEANYKRTSTPYGSYDSSSFWKLLAAPYCRRVVETKSRQNRTFDPANCKRTSTSYGSYDSSRFWKLLAAPYCRRVVETKCRQNRIFDPGGLQGHLRACPFLGSWRALVCGEVIRAGAAGDELERFFRGDSLAL